MKLEQWDISETITLEDQTLQLIGAGVRSMFILKPYVLAFYSTTKFDDYNDVIVSNHPKCMQLIINSEMINASMIVMGLKEGLNRTTYGQMPELKARFDHMFGLLSEFTIQKGDRVDLYANGKEELLVYLNGEQQFKENDSNVIKAIFGIWFSEAFDRKLRNSLLGR
ncbi:MAG: chalcone isomerase family protein [Bacteroidetes bacterium]|nr:chalcone isomerase family protein [Bacteroidota bacterium]